MAAVGNAPYAAHGTTTSTTAETWYLTQPVKFVRCTNHEAVGGDVVWVSVATGETSAAAQAAVVTAAAFTDDQYAVMPQETKVIFRSRRRTYVAGSVVGNASPVSIEGATTDLDE